jgi:hypothetical protein
MRRTARFCSKWSVVVAGEQNLDSILFGDSEQLAILEARPAHESYCGDFVRRKELSERMIEILVEQNPHAALAPRRV